MLCYSSRRLLRYLLGETKLIFSLRARQQKKKKKKKKNFKKKEKKKKKKKKKKGWLAGKVKIIFFNS